MDIGALCDRYMKQSFSLQRRKVVRITNQRLFNAETGFNIKPYWTHWHCIFKHENREKKPNKMNMVPSNSKLHQARPFYGKFHQQCRYLAGYATSSNCQIAKLANWKGREEDDHLNHFPSRKWGSSKVSK